MIHCLVARYAYPSRGPLLYIGNLALDAMHYPAKERLHLRLCDDRSMALTQRARSTDPGDDFAEGVLLHLYTDWLWDTTHLQEYRDKADPDDTNWFRRYQHETGLASVHLYHSHGWAPLLWESMLAVPICDYSALKDIAPESITNYLLHNSRQLAGSKGLPSEVYPPALAEGFAKEAAAKYLGWRDL